MQSDSMNRLVDESFNQPFDRSKLLGIFQQNTLAVNLAIQESRLPDETRSPTETELEEMAQWMADYRKANKRASKREVRKSCQQHFNIKIFRKPYNK